MEGVQRKLDQSVQVLQEAINSKGEEEESEPRAMLIDIKTVLQMFRELKTTFESAQSHSPVEWNNLDSKEFKDMQTDIGKNKMQLEILTSVMKFMGMKQAGLQEKLEMLEERNMRRSIVITGLETSDKVVRCIQQVDQFLAETFRVKVVIIDCFKMGLGSEKPVIVTVENIQQKTKIFQVMSIYGKQFDKFNRQTIFINDFLPVEKKERKRKQREIVKCNEQDQSSKLTMSIERGGLKINGEMYQPRIQPP